MPDLSRHQLSATDVVILGRVAPDADLSSCFSALSSDERARAAAFRTRQLHDTYVGTHGTLRLALSERLGIAAADLRFEMNPWGKPLLCSPFQHLHFNISHSHDRFAVGLSHAAPIGVDIERIAADAPYEIGPDFMSARELAHFSSLPGHGRHQLFYQLWVRKEAVVKALGMGLSQDLRRIDVLDGVSFLPAGNPTTGDHQRLPRFLDLHCPQGFAAAVASLSDD